MYFVLAETLGKLLAETFHPHFTIEKSGHPPLVTSEHPKGSSSQNASNMPGCQCHTVDAI